VVSVNLQRRRKPERKALYERQKQRGLSQPKLRSYRSGSVRERTNPGMSSNWWYTPVIFVFCFRRLSQPKLWHQGRSQGGRENHQHSPCRLHPWRPAPAPWGGQIFLADGFLKFSPGERNRSRGGGVTRAVGKVIDFIWLGGGDQVHFFRIFDF
jgi:hypothetical protein